jgi:hypothetical protein
MNAVATAIRNARRLVTARFYDLAFSPIVTLLSALAPTLNVEAGTEHEHELRSENSEA